jgi:hypothetical protein
MWLSHYKVCNRKFFVVIRYSRRKIQTLDILESRAVNIKEHEMSEVFKQTRLRITFPLHRNIFRRVRILAKRPYSLYHSVRPSARMY